MAPLPQTSPPPVPPPVPVETHPNRAGGLKHPQQQRALPDPNRLAPEDAYYVQSPPRVRSNIDTHRANFRAINGVATNSAAAAALRPPPAVPGAETTKKEPRTVRASSRRGRRKGAWKKLLWVKQSCM